MTSLMFEYLPWKALHYRLRPWMHTVSLHLGAFGAPTPKLTKLVGMCGWLPKLKRPLAASDKERIEEEGIKTAVCHGTKRKVSGSKHLKATQTYPVEFGAAVAFHFSQASAANTSGAASASSSAASASSSAALAATSLDAATAACATLPEWERPLLECAMQSMASAQGDFKLWAECKPWWLEDIIRDDDAYWDARLAQEHSLQLE